MFCQCYYFLCVLFTLAYVWGNDPVISGLHIDFFMECRSNIHQPIHCTQNVGTFVEQISDLSCVCFLHYNLRVVAYGFLQILYPCHIAESDCQETMQCKRVQGITSYLIHYNIQVMSCWLFFTIHTSPELALRYQ